MKVFQKSLMVCVLVLAVCSYAQAATWSLAGDLSFASNANGAWSYGWSWMGPKDLDNGIYPYIGAQPDTTTMTLYNTVRTPWDSAGGAVNTGWVDATVQNWYPSVVRLDSSYYWAPAAALGSVLIQGGSDSSMPQWSVVRWTAPTAGDYAINATLGGGYVNAGHTLGVIQNKTTKLLYKFNTAVGVDWSYSGTRTLNAGDTIDFIGGMGGIYDYGQGAWVSANATITQVPEPVTLLLLGAGAFFVRRNSK